MRKSKRLMALFLSVLIIFLVPIMSSAKDNADVKAGEEVIVSFSYYCNAGASSYSKEKNDNTYTRITPKGNRTYSKMRFVTTNSSPTGSPRHDSDGNIIWVYCVNFGVEANEDDKRAGATPSKTKDTAWSGLTAQQKRGIQLALLYGFPGSNNGGSAADAYMATQAILWEFQTGVRSSTTTNQRKAVTYKYTDIEGEKHTYEVAANYFYNIVKDHSGGKTAYNNIISKIYSHDTMPSFESKITLPYDDETGKFTTTITDKNEVLSKFDVTVGNGVVASVSGNKLTLTSDKPVSNVKLTLAKLDVTLKAQAQLILSSTTEGQTTILGQSQVDASKVLSVSTYNYHKIGVYKKGEVLKGFDENMKPIYEEEYLSDCTANICAAEDIKTGDDTVYEKDEIVETLTTNSSAPVYSKYLPEGKYYIKEIASPDGYVLNDTPITVDLFDDNQLITISDERQRCEIKFKKSMSNTTADAMSSYYKHVSFGLFTGEEILNIPKGTLLETLIPDDEGNCEVSVDLPYGYSYYIKELGTADGFILDENIYTIDFKERPLEEGVFVATVGNDNVVINEMKPVEIERKVLGESELVEDKIARTGEDSILPIFIALLSLVLSIVALVITLRKN